MRLLYPFIITFTIIEGIWSSLFYTRRDEVVKNFSFVNEKFAAPFIALFIIITGIVISSLFLLMGYEVNDFITLVVTTSIVYIVTSFLGSPTLLGNFLGF